MVTEREIMAARTKRGGWTRATLARWDVPYPPPKGWKKTLIRKADASRIFEKYPEYLWHWDTREGESILITQLSSDHIRNIINLKKEGVIAVHELQYEMMEKVLAGRPDSGDFSKG